MKWTATSLSVCLESITIICWFFSSTEWLHPSFSSESLDIMHSRHKPTGNELTCVPRLARIYCSWKTHIDRFDHTVVKIIAPRKTQSWVCACRWFEALCCLCLPSAFEVYCSALHKSINIENLFIVASQGFQDKRNTKQHEPNNLHGHLEMCILKRACAKYW